MVNEDSTTRLPVSENVQQKRVEIGSELTVAEALADLRIRLEHLEERYNKMQHNVEEIAARMRYGESTENMLRNDMMRQHGELLILLREIRATIGKR